jgi:serine/threonine-protein kinase
MHNIGVVRFGQKTVLYSVLMALSLLYGCQYIVYGDKHSKQQVTAEVNQTALSLKDTILILVGDVVSIPAGSYTMGCSIADNECMESEMPTSNQSISAFKLMAAEVTFDLWDACVDAGACSYIPYDRGWGRGNRPVINVSFDDITGQFIPWLNNVTHLAFRLPSEAEWEYAARAGSATKYSWGNSIRCTQARFAHFEGRCGNDKQTVPVKSYSANAFGLYDMHGNVWEWTQSCWNDSAIEAVNNNSDTQNTDCALRMLRGGSWSGGAGSLRVSRRFFLASAVRFDNGGFRLALDLEKTTKQ